MENATRRHFFFHGPHGPSNLEAEKDACHWCQIRSFKNHGTSPITIVNEVNSDVLKPSFRFIEDMVYRDGVEPAEASFRCGCECSGDGNECKFSQCSCLADLEYDTTGKEKDGEEEADDSSDDDDDNGENSDSEDEKLHNGGRKPFFVYYSHGKNKGMLRRKILKSSKAIYECHSGCGCSSACPNRVVDRGRTIPLQIFRTADGRGWGVRSSVPIKRGQFVDRYLGEVLRSTTAKQRRKGHPDDHEPQSTTARRRRRRQQKDVYLFALDKFSDPDSHDERLRADPVEVDGEFMAGPTRFVNHSCEPNMRIFARVGDYADRHLHDLAFFAIRDIPRGEELTFDYIDGVNTNNNDKDGDDLAGRTRCRCGSKNCRGYLW